VPQDNLGTLGTRNFFSFFSAFIAFGDVLGRGNVFFLTKRNGTARIELWTSATSLPDDDDGPGEKINGMSEDWVEENVLLLLQIIAGDY